MILNTFAILAAFVAVIQLGLGLAAVRHGLIARRNGTAHNTSETEDRGYLIFLLTFVLIALSVAAWPLLYFMLQSYVAEWPGVMCIRGVTRIGEGSLGSARHLPNLLIFLQWSKPALVFVGGAWYSLYILNRATRTSPLAPQLMWLMIPLGTLAVLDAGATLTYIGIPKIEEFASSGCCVAADENSATREPTRPLVGDALRPNLPFAFFGFHLGLALTLVLFSNPRVPTPNRLGATGLFLAGLVGLGIGYLFLIEFAAPALLRLPFHHCAYDLISDVPEAVVAIAIYGAALFLLGWAAVVSWFACDAETAPIVPRMVRRLLGLSYLAYFVALIMLSLELVLA